MKKIAVIFLSTLLLNSSAIASGKPVVVGLYNNIDVTDQQVMKQFQTMLDMQPNAKGKNFLQLDKQFQEALVKGYINQKLFEKEVEASKIKSSSEFKAKMKTAENQIAQQELIENYLKKAVTEKMIDDEYKSFIKNLEGQKEVKIAHILVDTQEKANELKKKINKGSKFSTLAKEHSKDTASKDNNGEIGYILKANVAPEFGSKAFSMKKGEISDPVKTNFGWHLIEVLDIRPVQILTKEQMNEEIKAKLSREAFQKYIADLEKKADVKIYV